MKNYEEIVEYNRKLFQAGLVEELVENTDWEPVSKFFAEVGSKGKEILDIGCATGSLAVRLATENYRWKSYRGVDIYKECVNKFNSRGIPEAKAEVGNGTNLNTQRDCSKNVVILLFVLQHLSEEDGMKALRELRRVAKPGADLFIGLTVNRNEIEERKRYVSKKAIELAGPEEVFNGRKAKDIVTEEGDPFRMSAGALKPLIRALGSPRLPKVTPRIASDRNVQLFYSEPPALYLLAWRGVRVAPGTRVQVRAYSPDGSLYLSDPKVPAALVDGWDAYFLFRNGRLRHMSVDEVTTWVLLVPGPIEGVLPLSVFVTDLRLGTDFGAPSSSS